MTEQPSLPCIRDWLTPQTIACSELLPVVQQARRDGFEPRILKVVREGYKVTFFKFEKNNTWLSLTSRAACRPSKYKFLDESKESFYESKSATSRDIALKNRDQNF